MLYLISCRRAGERSTAQFEDVLKDISSEYRRLNDVWVIESDCHASTLRDAIAPRLTDGEDVIVFLLAGHAAWSGFDAPTVDWLLQYL